MDWNKMLSVTFTGLIVVFIALILLIFVMWIMGKFASLKHKSSAAGNTATFSQNDEIIKAKRHDDDLKIVTAITAAIASYQGNDKFTIKSIIKDKGDAPCKEQRWAYLGLIDNTKPF